MKSSQLFQILEAIVYCNQFKKYSGIHPESVHEMIIFAFFYFSISKNVTYCVTGITTGLA